MFTDIRVLNFLLLRFSGPERFRHVPPKDKISRVKSEIRGVMDVMQNNISKVLDRGTKLDDLQDKSGTTRLQLH